MEKKKLHPAVEEFRGFIHNHPKLLGEVRAGKSTLQDLFEDWYLLGQDDPRWEPYRSQQKEKDISNESKSDWLGGILEKLKNIDPAQIESHISQLNQALGAVQGVLAQFHKGAGHGHAKSQSQKPNNPFQFRKD